MKVLYIQAGGPATVFTLAPLATALRNAGHQVVMATAAATMETVTSMGLATVRTTERHISHFITKDRAGAPAPMPSTPEGQALFTGGWFGRLAAESLGPLREFARGWRPDLVVGGPMSYAAPLLATELGVPWVRQAWDAIEADAIHPGAERELAPELGALGLDRLPVPDLFVDICPPSLRPGGAPAARMMRFVPVNAQRPLEPWMYERGTAPRICVTAGSRVAKDSYDESFAFLRGLVKHFAGSGAELIAPAPEDVAGELRAELPELRTGWIPMDIVAPTCDVIVHHAGGASTLTALNAGVPQLIVAHGTVTQPSALRVAAAGAARTLLPEEATADALAEGCEALLTDPGYRERAAGIAAEIAAMPAPALIADELTRLV